MIKKQQLFTPGPVTIPPQVLAATAEPMVHHRAPEFDPIFKKVSEDLKYVFQTANPVVTFASSGTGAMEAAVVNFHSPGDEIIVIEGGKFGERWAEIGRAHGLVVHSIKMEWGLAADAAKVREALKAHPKARAVYATLVETSTGTLTDIAAIAPVVNEHGALFVVDAVSALASEILKTDEWKIDVVVTGSQKALMLPPGLAFASLSAAAIERMKDAKCASYYFCFKKALKNLEKGTTAFTPAVSLLKGLQVALDMIKAETIGAVWCRHTGLANAMRAAVAAMGLELFSKSPANVVTAVKVPEGVDGGKIVKVLRDKYGITIAGGQDHLKGKIFRIATLGWHTGFDVIHCVAALELTLAELGLAFEPGVGLAAAQRTLFAADPALAGAIAAGSSR